MRVQQEPITAAMARGDFAGAMKLLPSTFREVYALPKVCEQVKAIGLAPVKAMIQVQLGILASLMTTGGNLNDAMANFIAGSLIDMFPTESVADFQLCFQRGAMGRYGQIQRMDGITIGEWMGKYLEEKYSELESHIDKRKANDVGKQPVDDLKPIYDKMKAENTKFLAVNEFNKQEYQKKYSAMNPEEIERLRQAEIDRYNGTEPTTIERPSVENPETKP